VYQPRGSKSQLVAWRLRYFFCSDHGLCYQKVSSQMRPFGEKRLIPWGSITKVEALLDDSIYLETSHFKTYDLKPKVATDPASAAWTWATRLCQLTQLLGNEVAGYVAMAAYGNLQKPAGYDGARPGCGPAVGFSASAMADATNSWGFDDDPFGDNSKLQSSRLPVPADAASGPTVVPYTNLAAITSATMGQPRGTWQGEAMPHISKGGAPAAPPAALEDHEAEEDEGEETAEEAYRRRQWIIYYVSIGQFAEAEDIGWDGRSPPDPRNPLAPVGTASQSEPPYLVPAPHHAAPSSFSPAAARAPPGASPDGIENADSDGILYAKNAGAPPQSRKPGFPFGRKGSKEAEYEPILPSVASKGRSPLGARNSALGWLQQRMSQIGRTPSSGMQTPNNRTPGSAEDIDDTSVTPLAMAPI